MRELLLCSNLAYNLGELACEMERHAIRSYHLVRDHKLKDAKDAVWEALTSSAGVQICLEFLEKQCLIDIGIASKLREYHSKLNSLWKALEPETEYEKILKLCDEALHLGMEYKRWMSRLFIEQEFKFEPKE